MDAERMRGETCDAIQQAQYHAYYQQAYAQSMERARAMQLQSTLMPLNGDVVAGPGSNSQLYMLLSLVNPPMGI